MEPKGSKCNFMNQLIKFIFRCFTKKITFLLVLIDKHNLKEIFYNGKIVNGLEYYKVFEKNNYFFNLAIFFLHSF